MSGLTFATACAPIYPIEPQGGPAAAAPTVESSTISLHVDADLSGVQRTLNNALPLCPGDAFPVCHALITQCEGAWGAKTWVGWPLFLAGFKYSVWRFDGLQMGGSGRTLSLRQPLLYHAKGALYRPIGYPGWLTIGSCGYGEPARGATVGVDADLSWDPPRWRVRSRTRGSTGNFSPRCSVTFLDIDVTDKVEAIVHKQIEKVTTRLDATIPSATDITETAGTAWLAMQRPIRIVDRAWLMINPSDVSVGPLHFSGSHLAMGATIVAQPSVVLGQQPDAGTLPLPPLREETADGRFRLLVSILIPYERITEPVHQQIGGQRDYRNPGGFPPTTKLHVRDTRMRGDGDTAIVTLEVEGGLFGIFGKMHLTGRPHYDADSRQISLQTLRFDEHTRNMLKLAAEGLLETDFEEAIENAAQASIADLVERARRQLTAALNREITDGVVLSGTVDTIVARGIWFEPNGMRLVVEVQGQAALAIAPVAYLPPIGTPQPVPCVD